MAFNSYEELKAAVEARRQAVLTLEIDLGSAYSPEYEAAKKELVTAQSLKSLAGGQGFLSDNLAELEAKVAELKPESASVWAQYHKIPLDEWGLLMKAQNMTPVDQYEKVLPKVFVALYGVDPVDDEGNPVEGVEPLSTDAALLSSRSPKGILPGAGLNPVVQAFMAWQNSGGDVTIRPTKSGRA